jgi:hypothetical protein
LTPAPVNKKDRKGVDESVTAQCKYPGNPEAIREAQGHILQAHAERGELVTVVDIEAGRAPRSRESEPFHPDPLHYDARRTHLRLSMSMSRQQLFAAWNAFKNLADPIGNIRVTLEAHKSDGFDPT